MKLTLIVNKELEILDFRCAIYICGSALSGFIIWILSSN